MKYVIKTATLSDAEDIKFVSNINTHCDFLIYNKLNKEIEMVVEVDGSQHKEEIQVARDMRKDRLLTAAGIKILRLPTTTIECKEKIISVLTDNIDSIILQERTNRIASVSDDIQTIYLRKGLTDEKL